MTVVALAATRDTARRVAPLLALLGRRCRVVSWRRWCAEQGPSSRPDAIVATDVSLLEQLPDVPTAVWVTGADDRVVAAQHGARVLLTGAAEEAGPGIVLVPEGGIDVGRVLPLAPLVRARHRDVAGLPEVLVFCPSDGAPVAPSDLRRSSAVVATDADLPLALALGTPVVTSAAAARRLGAEPGRHLLVADGPGALDVALRLALDPSRSARCSTEARRFAEDHLDLGPVARDVGLALGLSTASRPYDLGGLGARLDELGAPPEGWLRRRMGERVAAIDGGLDQTRPMVAPSSAPVSAPVVRRARHLLARAAEPLRSRVKGALAAAAAEGTADLRDEVGRLQRDLDQARLEHAAELAVLHEELAARRGVGADPSLPG